MICLEIYPWILRKLPTTSVVGLSRLRRGFLDEKNFIDGFISGVRFGLYYMFALFSVPPDAPTAETRLEEAPSEVGIAVAQTKPTLPVC